MQRFGRSRGKRKDILCILYPAGCYVWGFETRGLMDQWNCRSGPASWRKLFLGKHPGTKRRAMRGGRTKETKKSTARRTAVTARRPRVAFLAACKFLRNTPCRGSVTQLPGYGEGGGAPSRLQETQHSAVHGIRNRPPRQDPSQPVINYSKPARPRTAGHIFGRHYIGNMPPHGRRHRIVVTALSPGNGTWDLSHGHSRRAISLQSRPPNEQLNHPTREDGVLQSPTISHRDTRLRARES